jgi:hypothetical protein
VGGAWYGRKLKKIKGNKGRNPLQYMSVLLYLVSPTIHYTVLLCQSYYFAILDGHFTFAMGQQTRTLGHGCSLSEKIDNSLHYMGTGGIQQARRMKKIRRRIEAVAKQSKNREIPRFGI